MNARVDVTPSASAAVTAAGRAEHISLESTPETYPPPPNPVRGKVRSSFTLTSKLRSCSTELSILEDHFLWVRSIRAGSRKDYVLDLRFANATPMRVRRIAWGWLAVTAILFGAAGALAWAASSLQSLSTAGGFLAAAGALLGGGVAMFLFLRNTTESLQFTSMHGGATLVSITGGIGSGKVGKPFFVEVIKHIGAARLARPQQRPQLLRDEMREHHRLHQLGVLTSEDYEAGKARILKSHA